MRLPSLRIRRRRARLGGYARAVKLWAKGRGLRHWPADMRPEARALLAEGRLITLAAAGIADVLRRRHAPGDGMVCGARAKRTGKPCQKAPMLGHRRCRLHGGASTGPRTPEGKRRALEALARGRATRAARAR